jgi:hypothetical protein
VTPSTNRDSPWIAWAGVETGAKMFVGLSGEGVDCAEAVAARKHRPTRTKGTRIREWFGCVVYMSLVDGVTWLPNDAELTRSTDHAGARSGPQAAAHGVVVRGRYLGRIFPTFVSVVSRAVWCTVNLMLLVTKGRSRVTTGCEVVAVTSATRSGFQPEPPRRCATSFVTAWTRPFAYDSSGESRGFTSIIRP